MKRLICIAGFLFVFACALAAQETRATLLGHISDPQGAVIPAASIRIVSVDTNTVARAVSNESGYYEAPFLMPGKYRIEVEMQGFKAYVREGVELSAGQRTTLDVSMQVGQTTESITVSAEAPLLETATATAGQHIDTRRLADLPLMHMNPFLSPTLVAGVTNSQGTGGARPWDRNNYAPVVAGSAGFNNEFSTDGMTSQYAGNRVAYVPTTAIVQEMKVETMSVDASSGGHAGIFVNAATKSGTNEVHGMLWDMHRQNRWNATNFFTNRDYYHAVNNGKRDPRSPKQASGRYNNFGATIGGPVYVPKIYNGKNRTFFFFSYNGLYESGGKAAEYRMPTAKERDGDFSELLARGGAEYTIYDPATARLEGGKVVRSPFPGNRVPTDRISPIARNYLKIYPMPNAEGDVDFSRNYFDGKQPSSADYNAYFFRLDHQFSERHKMFFRWNDSRYGNNNGDWTGAGYNNEANIKENPGVIVDDVITLNASTVLNVKFGWGKNTDSHEPGTRGVDPSSLGFPSYLKERAGEYYHMPGVSFSQLPGLGLGWGDHSAYNVYTGTASLQTVRGNHSLKTGVDLRWYAYDQFQPGQAAGTFGFSNAYTKKDDVVSARSSGLEIAAFLLGQPNSGTINSNAKTELRDRMYAAYIQDDWRVSRRLTLNLGLRYEFATPMVEAQDRMTRSLAWNSPSPIAAAAEKAYAANPLPDFAASRFKVMGGPLFAGLNGAPRGIADPDWNNFGPRVGAAYKLNDRMVVRGSYAVFYNMGTGSQGRKHSNYGFSQATNLTATLDRGVTFIGKLGDPFPAIQEGGKRFLDPMGSSLGLMTQVGANYWLSDTNEEAPMQHRWRLGYEYEFAKGWLAEIAYVGSLGRKLWIGNRSITPIPQEFWATGNVRNNALETEMARQVANPFAGLIPRSPNYNSAKIAKQLLLRPYPHFNGMTMMNSPLGSSDYQGLEGRIEKRFSRGWTVMANFTKQRAMQATSFLNEFDPEPIRELSGDDRDYRVAINGIYELPFGRGRRFGAGAPKWVLAPFGGWKVAAVYQTQGGIPLGFGNLFFNGDYSQILLPRGQRTLERWFNTAGFVRTQADQPGSYHVRNNPNRLDNRLRGDNQNQWDLAVHKDFNFSEHGLVKLKLDLLNAFNHPQFSNPNTSPTSTTFGQVAGQGGGPSRIIQLHLQVQY